MMPSGGVAEPCVIPVCDGETAPRNVCDRAHATATPERETLEGTATVFSI